jgi:hypothetical protein
MLNERKATKSQKEGGMVLTVSDDVWGTVFRNQCLFPYIEGMAMLNEKWE